MTMKQTIFPNISKILIA